jgi:Prokaryotic E2 family E
VLPSSDAAYLAERGYDHQVVAESGMVCVVITGWPLPPGYTSTTADLLLRLSPTYPDTPPDMWWFSPAVARADGQPIPATESMEPYLQRTWQRWSRHFASGQWLSGTDGLESYLALVSSQLVAHAGLAA